MGVLENNKATHSNLQEETAETQRGHGQGLIYNQMALPNAGRADLEVYLTSISTNASTQLPSLSFQGPATVLSHCQGLKTQT